MPRLKIGQLLVSAKVLTEEQLEVALRQQREAGLRLGELLVSQGVINETQLTQTLGQQLSVPWVSLYHVDFSRQLLNLVPREIAERFCLAPIYVRRVRKQGDTLYVAMDDPTNELAMQEVSSFAGLPVRPMIACPTDIRNAIRVYYAAAPEATPHLPSPPPVLEPPKKEPKSRPPNAVAAVPIQMKSEDSPDAAPEIETRMVSIPPPRKGPKQKMVSLTLLDGTSIQLPARRSKRRGESLPPPSEGAPEEFTARDLISALRAVAHGASASEILGGEAQWERLFAAMMSILLKKGLIADWEFVEEFRKM